MCRLTVSMENNRREDGHIQDVWQPWWRLTRPLAQPVEAAGEVVVTDGLSDWWYSKGERPETVLESLGLADLLG